LRIIEEEPEITVEKRGALPSLKSYTPTKEGMWVQSLEGWIRGSGRVRLMMHWRG